MSDNMIDFLNNIDNAENIVGIDEVGYGCWAGPLYICALKFIKGYDGQNIFCDSKSINHTKRLKFYEKLKEIAIWNIGKASVEEINELGLAHAYKNALKRACANFIEGNYHFAIDGNSKKEIIYSEEKKINFINIVKGDTKIQAIAAASIIAKVERDNLMDQLHEQYPQYHWAKNKGYGTKAHIDALKIYGFSNEHRTSYNLGKYL